MQESPTMADETDRGTEPSNIAPANPVADDGGRRVLEDWEREIDDKFLIDMNLLTFESIVCERHSSIVYEGRYKDLHVAVKKVLESTSGPDPESNKMFRREIAILSQVNHKNVVKFVGASVDDMTIITEYMMGGSLKKYLMDMHPRRPDLQTAIGFALDIAHAMEYLHANDIIHRDLKPTNLLLTEDKMRLKLADFGSARGVPDEDKMTTEIGSYKWMAPEVYGTEPLERGEKKHYTHKADIHSFAMVLWELITNCSPFKGMSNMQAAYAVATNQRPSLKDIPEGLAPLLESCWADNPDNRPESTEIITILSEFLDKLEAEQASSSHNDAVLDKLQPEQPASSQNDAVLDTLQAEQASSLQNDAVGQEDYSDLEESPGSGQFMDKSDEDEERKPRSSSPKFFSCFDKCFS